MDNIVIKETENTPEISFKTTGKMYIKGKSLPEDPIKFYTPLFKWAEEIDADDVQIDVKLEYVNTSSSKNILELVKLVDKNPNIKKLILNWYYEEDDMDMLEFGQMIERSTRRTRTNYLACDDLDD